MSKPLIGMVALVNNHTQSCGTISKCLDVVVQAGGLPTLVPMTGKEELFYQAVEMCDGFIIAGEDDFKGDFRAGYSDKGQQAVAEYQHRTPVFERSAGRHTLSGH